MTAAAILILMAFGALLGLAVRHVTRSIGGRRGCAACARRGDCPAFRLAALRKSGKESAGPCSRTR